jgi:hypothetical protein
MESLAFDARNGSQVARRIGDRADYTPAAGQKRQRG